MQDGDDDDVGGGFGDDDDTSDVKPFWGQLSSFTVFLTHIMGMRL